jgi:hypothetical protein
LGILSSTFRVSRKNKFMLLCVRVQVHFKKNISLKLKNKIRISGFIEEHQVFCKVPKSQRKDALAAIDVQYGTPVCISMLSKSFIQSFGPDIFLKIESKLSQECSDRS